MTDRERLIELMRGVKLPINVRNILGSYDTVGETYLGDNDIERIVDHLLANDVIVPPCKVGDKMYFDGKYFASHCAGEIMERRVDAVLTEVWATFRGDVDVSFDFESFGKIVFLTKEEAEQALKEREGK